MISLSANLLMAEVVPRYAPEGWERLVENPTMLTAVATLGAIALLVAVGFSWRERKVIKPGRWKTLALLRLLAICAAGVALSGWQRRPTTERVDPSRVVLLVDSSTSMLLTDEAGSKRSRHDHALATTTRLLELLGTDHDLAVARFGDAVTYSAEEDSANSPTDISTRLGDALRRVATDYQSAPLAGVVLLSDGRSNEGLNPRLAAEAFVDRGVPIHTIGFGALVEPESVTIARLDVPERVQTGDPMKSSLVVSVRGTLREQVKLIVSLRAKEATDSESQVVHSESLDLSSDLTSQVVEFEFDAPEAGEYLLEAQLDGASDSSPVQVAFESVDQKTQILLLAGGPTRDYRFLRNQLQRDNAFEVDVLLQSAVGGITQDARKILEAFPESPEALDAYDVVVAFDPDWSTLGETAQANLRDWVAERGGGLFLVAGVAHAFAIGGQAFPGPIAQLAPIEMADEPLGALTWNARVDQPQEVRLTQAGSSVGFLKLGGSGDIWNQLEGFYASPPKGKPKLGTTIYATLGDEEKPLLAEHFYGAGRVLFLATAETWRLRQIDAARFTELHTKLLRRLAQGRVQGAAARGNLYFDRSRYEVGETMTLRLVLKERGQEVPRILWHRPGGETEQLSMTPAPAGDNIFLVTQTAELEGEYEARFAFDSGALMLNSTAETTLPARESLATTRDQETLRELAQMTSGSYFARPEAALSTDSEAIPIVQKSPRELKRTRLSVHPTKSLVSPFPVRRCWR